MSRLKQLIQEVHRRSLWQVLLKESAMNRLTVLTRPLCMVLVCLALWSLPGQAQQVYLGGGLGYTFVLNGSGGARNVAGSIGLETRGPLGFRLEGNETISLFFLTANASYTFGSREGQIRPYLIGGVGGAFAILSQEQLTVNLGAGVFLFLSSHLRMFAESRLFHFVESGHPTILPVTVGLHVLF